MATSNHTITKPPHSFGSLKNCKSVFLAGSIEMGKAVDWQVELTNHLAKELPKENVHILNPRRNDWDNSWKQSRTDANFLGQVEWELDAQDQCDVIAMYFDPATKSPISLLELGLYAQSGKMVVCCPEGFWRKGNVEVVCDRYHVDMVEDIDEFYATVIKKLSAPRPTAVSGLR